MKPILVVEDSPMFGRMIKNKIEEKIKTAVIWTTTLADTRSVLERSAGEFSVALLDFTLPDAPEGEVIDEVVAKGIPVIVFTSNIESEVRDKIWAKKVADYVSKEDPNSLDYIVSLINQLQRNKESKILVVDDSSFFRKIISDLLYIQQYEVLTAESGRDALHILDKFPDIKVVITDFNMPNMDGCILSQKIRQKFKKEDLAIIGISAEGDKNMAVHFIKSGANDFIVKQTFLVEEFYCRVNQCIENIDLIRTTRIASIRDFLSGLYNRRYYFDAGRKFFLKSKRDHVSLLCAMIDIDFFKKVNDTYGHDVGDLVIQHVASLLQDSMREGDIVCRFGGEEFCVLAGHMEIDRAFTMFEQIRRLIQDTPIYYHNNTESLRITVSIGLSCRSFDSLEQLTKDADEQLYKAKNNGRNRVECAS